VSGFHDEVLADGNTGVELQHFVAVPPLITLDTVFQLNVIKAVSFEEFQVVKQDVLSLLSTQTRLRLEIVVLDAATRENIHLQTDVFWCTHVAPGQAVSRYYQRGCICNGTSQFTRGWWADASLSVLRFFSNGAT